MDNPEAKRKEVAVAVRGYGYFASVGFGQEHENTLSPNISSAVLRFHPRLFQPCKVFLKATDVRFMFNEMIQRSEQIFFRSVLGSSS